MLRTMPASWYAATPDMARPFRYTGGSADMVEVRLDSARLQYRETAAVQPPREAITEGFPSHAVQREIAAAHAARVMQPFTPAVIFVAAALFIAAMTLGLVAAERADRAIDLAERV